MSDQPAVSDAPVPVAAPSSLPGWNADLRPVSCQSCGWRYLVHPGAAPARCPHCAAEALAPLPEDAPHSYPPEQVLPFKLSKTALEESVRSFAGDIPYPPESLTPAALRSRLTPLYLPVWLVDGKVHALWQAEMGFYYQVISHQESYNQNLGKWQSKEIKEQRTRWEPRIGRLTRAYNNLHAPAAPDSISLEKSLGGFTLATAEPYRPEHVDTAAVRLPEHTPQQAWSEASKSFQTAAVEECRQASGADEIRQFKWKAQVNRLNWTLLLLPVYAASYLDDDGKPQPVLIHGQTGHVTGSRRSSMKRARQVSLRFFLAAVALIVLGLVLGAVSADGFATLAILAGIGCFIGTLIPIIVAWGFNSRQS